MSNERPERSWPSFVPTELRDPSWSQTFTDFVKYAKDGTRRVYSTVFQQDNLSQNYQRVKEWIRSAPLSMLDYSHLIAISKNVVKSNLFDSVQMLSTILKELMDRNVVEEVVESKERLTRVADPIKSLMKNNNKTSAIVSKMSVLMGGFTASLINGLPGITDVLAERMNMFLVYAQKESETLVKIVDESPERPVYKKLYQTMLQKYWEPDMSLSLIHQFMTYKINIDKTDKEIAVYTTCGPLMTKVLQRISKYAPRSSQIHKTLNNVSGVGARKIKRGEDSELDSIMQVIKENFPKITFPNDMKRNVASIGEVWFVNYTEEDSESVVQTQVPVALKFARPRSLAYFLFELEWIIKTIDPIFVTNALNSATKDERVEWEMARLVILNDALSILEEFNYNEEAENMKVVGPIYSKLPYVKATKCIGLINTPIPVIIQTKASGIPVSKLIENGSKLEVYQFLTIFKPLLTKWLMEALLGSGRFHADLHAGNMLWDSKTNTITMIDFGSCGKLTHREQKYVIRLAHSVERIRHYLSTKQKQTFSGMFKQLFNTKKTPLPPVEGFGDEKSVARVVDSFIGLCDLKSEKRKLLIDELTNYYDNLTDLPTIASSIEKMVFVLGIDLGKCATNSMQIFGRGLGLISGVWDKSLKRVYGDGFEMEVEKVLKEEILTNFNLAIKAGTKSTFPIKISRIGNTPLDELLLSLINDLIFDIVTIRKSRSTPKKKAIFGTILATLTVMKQAVQLMHTRGKLSEFDEDLLKDGLSLVLAISKVVAKHKFLNSSKSKIKGDLLYIALGMAVSLYKRFRLYIVE